MRPAFNVRRARIGLDIGSTAVRAAEVQLSPPTLVRVAQVRLQPGGVENGEIRDVQAVAAAIQELWSVGRFKSRRVHLGIGNQRVLVREITLPWLADKEMRASLPFQVQEHVPIPIEEAVLDYHAIEEMEVEGRRMVRVLLVAAQKVSVQQAVQAAEMAKLIPVGVDIIPFAIVRAVGSVDGLGLADDNGSVEAVVDVGSDITSICVHEHGLPRFVRILTTAGREITQAIGRSTGLPDEEAERLKRGESDEPEEVQRTADEVRRARAMAFVDEIRSSLDFYASQARGVGVGRVIVTGGGSKLTGLTALLEEQLPIGVVEGHAFQRVAPALDLVPEAMAAAEPVLSVAVGLAIPGGES